MASRFGAEVERKDRVDSLLLLLEWLDVTQEGQLIGVKHCRGIRLEDVQEVLG